MLRRRHPVIDARLHQHAVVLEGSRQRITPLRFGTILFLASELMFFAGLFAAYFSLRAINDPWPPADVELDLALPSVATVLLVISSFTFIAALRGLLPGRGHGCDHGGEHGVHGHVGAFSLPSLRRLLRTDGSFEEIDARGFRLVSGGPFAPLEDRRWWWRWNAWWGRRLPSVCAEVQLVLTRR